jgi:hypothetical protein
LIKKNNQNLNKLETTEKNVNIQSAIKIYPMAFERNSGHKSKSRRSRLSAMRPWTIKAKK